MIKRHLHPELSSLDSLIESEVNMASDDSTDAIDGREVGISHKTASLHGIWNVCSDFVLVLFFGGLAG